MEKEKRPKKIEPGALHYGNVNNLQERLQLTTEYPKIVK